ncbi:MAG: transketolase [Armatimonadota bacterium]|nr:transketolase [Armatimonadota bacterium]
MAIVDIRSGSKKELTIPELEAAARVMRAYALVAIHAAGTGHPGGSLSIMDVNAMLFLHEMNHDPSNPCWEDRDRLFYSAGHKAPALYVGLAKSGYFPIEDTVTLRRCGSDFQGHPHCLKLDCVEVSSGSLGQGLGISVGDALAARLNGKNYRVYCVMGDGEQQEGSVWEAAMSAGHFGLDNLCAIVDKNRLQIDGWVKDVMDIDPLADKYRAFGWHAIEIDGHNMQKIHDAFEEARRTKDKPTVIIAHTIKGKGVSFMENQAGWHGVATKTREQLDQALADLNVPSLTKEKVDDLLRNAQEFSKEVAAEIDASQPRFSANYWWNSRDNMKVEMDPTRMGFGRAMSRIGDDERIVTLHADISSSIRITGFEEKSELRKDRVFSVGIAEQNMMQVAAGMAKEGRIPVTGTYGVFAAGRPWDQIRTTICYGNLNVKIAGAHGGISVGADGATHQALEEISLMSILPNMIVEVPADSIETDRATEICVLEIVGPTYLRFAREATPIITTQETPYKFGVANVIRFRGEKPNFVDAFETRLSTDYRSEKEDLCIIACGPMVPEAMRAAWLLKSEKGIETRTVNIHTVKPIDGAAIVAAANEIGIIVTAEEHQAGGFGNIVAGIAATRTDDAKPLRIAQIGVQDRFGESGEPWELMKLFELTAEHIATKALKLLGR